VLLQALIRAIIDDRGRIDQRIQDRSSPVDRIEYRDVRRTKGRTEELCALGKLLIVRCRLIVEADQHLVFDNAGREIELALRIGGERAELFARSLGKAGKRVEVAVAKEVIGEKQRENLIQLAGRLHVARILPKFEYIAEVMFEQRGDRVGGSPVEIEVG